MKKELIFIVLVLICITSIFFYPVFKGQIPFPGDLLVGQYVPYSTNSYFGIAPGGVPNKGQSFDTLRIVFPWKEYAIKSLRNGSLPFWNPYNFSGTPFLANFQGGTFYPFNILFLILPILIAWTIYIIAQPFLAFFFTYLFIRELKLSRSSALLGGLIFAFSSYMTVWLEYGNFGHALLWFPLILLLIEKNIKKPKIILIVALITSLTLSILAGYIQITIYVFFFSFIFLLFRIFSNGHKNPLRKIIFYIPVFIIPGLLSAPQLFPTLELFFQSARSAYAGADISRLLIPPQHLITTFVPDFFGNPATRNYWLNGTYIERVSYIGVIPLFFILYAYFTKKKMAIFWFFAMLGGLVYFISFYNPVSHFFYSLPIPFINTTVPTRMMFVFCFASAICAAFGLNSWEKDKEKNLKQPLLILGFIYFFCWISVLALPHFSPSITENMAIARRNLILPTSIFAGLAILLIVIKLKFKKQIIIVLIFLITIFDLFYFFHKITPFSPGAYFYPQTEVLTQLKKIQGIYRSWGYGSGYIDTNFQTHEGIFSTDGYDPLFIKNYAKLISTSNDGQLQTNIPRTDVNLAKGFGTDSLRKNIYRQKLLNLLGIKYILNKNEQLNQKEEPDNSTFDPQKYKLVWQKTPWQIYENKEVLPRAFLAFDYILETDQDKIIKTIFTNSFNPRKKVILEEPLPQGIKLVEDSNAILKMLNYSPDKIVIETGSGTNALLFISDNYSPGWKVTIDGKNAKVYKADYTFRAVLLEKGKHSVIFSYYPESFDIGWKISLLALGFLSTGLYLAKRKKITLP